MANPYAAPEAKPGGQEDEALEGFSRDLGLVRAFLAAAGWPLLAISAGVSAVLSLLMDLQGWFAPEMSASPMSLMSAVVNIALAAVVVRVAVGRWQDPQGALGPMVQDAIKRLGPMVGPLFVRGILTVLGTVFFVVPGLVFAARTMTIEAIVMLGLDQGGPDVLEGPAPKKGIRAAWAFSEGKTLSMMGGFLAGLAPFSVLLILEAAWQMVAFEQGVGLGVLLAVSTPLAAIRGFFSILLPLFGAARVLTWMQARRQPLIWLDAD